MRRHYPLRTHLLLLVLGTLLPALVLAAYLLPRIINDSREELDRRLLETARAEAALVDAELSGTIRALQALALSPRLTAGDLEAFSVEAQQLKLIQRAWFAIVLLDSEGRVLVNTARPFRLPAAGDAEVESPSRELLSPAPVVGNLGPDLAADGRLAFRVRVPVMPSGRVKYSLSAIITPGLMADVLRREPVPSDEWVRGVLDGNGILVARTRDPERFVGKAGSPKFLRRLAVDREALYRDTALDGQPVYGAFARASQTNWVAAVAVRASMAESPFPRSLVALAGLGIVLLAAGGAGAFVISRRLSRDIAAAAAAADALAGGLPPAMPVSPVTEVQRLAAALTRSALLIEAHERERDEQIKRADAARAAAEAADRAKDDFLATLGHELRNPLAPALAALHLMRLRGDVSSQRERDIIERQVRHLARLVDDLLDVSRARSGRIQLRRRPFDIVHAVETAVEISGPLIAERGHQLIVDVPTGLIVDGDETRLAQVFANLLNNAAKYSDGSGHILLTASADGGFVVVQCKDDGIGIGEELLPHVFDLFAQGRQSLDRGHGGLGLGLAVVKTLVELHGGTVDASSPGIGQGSTFSVRLPFATRKAESSPAPVEPAPEPGHGRRVLVVDDNRDAADMLSEMLRLGGFEVVTAFDALTALKIVEDCLPEIAIFDIGLPRMNGLELARRVRQDPALRRVRLIAVTGYGQANDVEASLAAGFDRHLVKPILIDELLAAIEGR